MFRIVRIDADKIKRKIPKIRVIRKTKNKCTHNCVGGEKFVT